MAQLYKHRRKTYSYAHLPFRTKKRLRVIINLANKVVLEGEANHRLKLRRLNNSLNNLSQLIKASVGSQRVTSTKVLGASRILSASRNQRNQIQQVLSKQSIRPLTTNRTLKLQGCILQITRQTKSPPSFKIESSYQVKLKISILLATVPFSIYH